MGRRQGIVSGPDEVNLVTTARGELSWVPLQEVEMQVMAPTSPNPIR